MRTRMSGNQSTGRPWAALGTGGIPLNVTLHSWPVPPPEPESKGPAVDVETLRSNVTSRVFNLNATGYVAFDEDISEAGFTDMQTLILAGFGTLLTLIVAVGGVLGLRMLWVRYRQGKSEDYTGVLQREESSDPGRAHGPHELKSSESQFTAGTSDEPTQSPTLLTPKSNGSVITMTLKNNQLIVETEEATDMSPSIRVDSRGSTTTYVTNDGFPTEVQTGPAKSSSSDHGALIHRPPDELEEEDKRSSQTGLSQSDLSMSSSGSQNISYRYGNQVGYDTGGFGYPETPSEPGPARPSNSSSREQMRYSRSPSLMERNDSVGSASEITSYYRSVPLTGNPDSRLQGAVQSGEALERTNNLPNGNERPASLLLPNTKVSRCEELRREPSPIEEIEKHPGSLQQPNS